MIAYEFYDANNRMCGWLRANSSIHWLYRRKTTFIRHIGIINVPELFKVAEQARHDVS